MDTAVVGVKRRRPRRSPASWRALFRRFDASGVGVEDFCRREEVSRSSFNRWRNMLGLSKLDRAVSVDVAAPAFIDLDALPSPPVPASSPVSRLEIRLDLGSGVVLHLVRG